MGDDIPKRPWRILVTGIGGAGGFDLARALMRLGCEVIGTDADPLAPGLALPDITPRAVLPAGARGYDVELIGLCRELRPHALLPTVEAELPDLVVLRESLSRLGVRTWLPELDAVLACLDKARLHTVLTAHSIPTPRTFLPHEINRIPTGYQLVVKPRRGQGAKDVYFCATPDQARTLCELVDEPIVQQRIHGREFTADALIDRDGRISVILRRRLLVKGGLAVVSSTFHDTTLTELVTRALHAVGAVGACCVQGFLPESGRPAVLTEINARVGGGFPASEAAGADYIGQTLNGLLGLPIEHDRLTYAPGTRLTKYIETLTVERTSR